MNNIWYSCTSEQIAWVEKFKTIFINQDKHDIKKIFDVQNFGIHNSFNMQEYCNYEFSEFALKADKFSLTHNASIECYQLKDNFFYFSLGKKNDKAVFEAIFKWHNGLVIGNGYNFKIEPKIQFIKKISHNFFEETALRRINVTPRTNINIKAIICSEEGEEFLLNKIKLEGFLGGTFYNLQYRRCQENSFSYWDQLKILTDNGIINQHVLMRGIDHPLFISDLYPQIKNNTVTIKKDIFPVILYILFKNGEEKYFKYPLENIWHFDSPISKVCLTDTLSFDWIIEQI